MENGIDEATRDAILSIPLASHWPVDSVYWLYSTDGRYTVKSGYWLGRLGAANAHPNAPLNACDRLWPKIWNLDCPPKMRHFLWRACKGSLATNQVRFRRHIAQSPLCGRCQEEPETICHALVDCRMNKVVWESHPGGLLIAGAPRTSFLDLFGWLVEHASMETLILCATAMWATWFKRNKTIFENCTKPIEDAVFKFTAMVREYCSYASKVFSPRIQQRPLPTQWPPPEEDWVKLTWMLMWPMGLIGVWERSVKICMALFLLSVFEEFMPIGRLLIVSLLLLFLGWR